MGGASQHPELLACFQNDQSRYNSIPTSLLFLAVLGGKHCLPQTKR